MTWYAHTLHLEEDKYGTPDSNSVLSTCHSLQAIGGWYKRYVCTNVSVLHFANFTAIARICNHLSRALYHDFLKKDGIQFDHDAPSDFTAKGSYRPLIAFAEGVEVIFNGKKDSKADAIDTALVTITDFKLKFDLPRGSYVTMLMREMLLTMVIRS